MPTTPTTSVPAKRVRKVPVKYVILVPKMSGHDVYGPYPTFDDAVEDKDRMPWPLATIEPLATYNGEKA